MKKFVIFFMLMVVLLVGVCFETNAGDVCPECKLYTHEIVLPYLTSVDSGWWTGVAITNPTDDPVLCRLDYICDNSIDRIDVAPKSIAAFVVGIGQTSYAKVRSSAPLYITVLIGDGKMMQGYCTQLELINPASPATETEVAR